MIGAPDYDVVATRAVFVYSEGGGGLRERDGEFPAARLDAADRSREQLDRRESVRRRRRVAGAGTSTRTATPTIVVGAPVYHAGAVDGAAFDVHREAAPSAFVNTSATRWCGSQARRALRLDASRGAGDVNGDGFADVIAAPALRLGPDRRGRGLRVSRLPGMIQTLQYSDAAKVYLLSTQASSRFGTSIASAGDVNGDGSPT